MKSYSKWILTGATVLLMQGMYAREHWGPPPACPQPKADCKPKCEKPKPCNPKPSKKECQPVCDPCCPPVCFERGFATDPCCTPSAYSEPAAFDMRCGADAYFTVDFIYWQVKQGGMDLAVPGQATTTTVGGVPTITTNTVSPSALGKNILVQEFQYKPGFKVGLGWEGGMDNWVLGAEYTRLYGETHTSANAPSVNAATVNNLSLPQTAVWLPTSWFSGIYTNAAASRISSEWNYGINLVDATISRPFYSGARLIFEPYFGLRGAWIFQSMRIVANNIPSGSTSTPFAQRVANYHSHTSAVGPRVGLNGNWHLGAGFRFIGDAAASILYTSFDVKENVDSPDAPPQGAASQPFPVSVRYDDYNIMSGNFDLSLGLGWGSYFCCRRMHWDLAATYDFSIFTNQNMMRNLADLTSSNSSHPGGGIHDLFMQGLTISTRFDY